MSAVVTSSAVARNEPALATLFPGYFALVMATGIVSIAAHFSGMTLLAQVLLWINVAAYVVLWILFAARLVLFRARFLADLTGHSRSVLFLTMVAGTCVLGNQVALLTPWLSLGAALWVLGLGLWLGLLYTFFAVVTIRVPKPPFEELINGSWLLVVVSTESICVLGVLVDSALGGTHWVLLISLALHLIGVLLYLPLITLILYRWMFFPFKPEQMTPPYWINMGALAISTLAGSRLLLAAPNWDLLQELAPFLRGFTLLWWAMATWWIPLLAVVGVWRHVVRRVPLRYDPQYWALVFPLGMYTVATYVLIRATGLTMLTPLPQAFVFVALIAWLLTFAGLVGALLRPVLRRS